MNRIMHADTTTNLFDFIVKVGEMDATENTADNKRIKEMDATSETRVRESEPRRQWPAISLDSAWSSKKELAQVEWMPT